ncbi:porin family protein [Sphingosinicellaceae bacterium]|nr:porin family protein [Sphingosinicellaceae bacterium]
MNSLRSGVLALAAVGSSTTVMASEFTGPRIEVHGGYDRPSAQFRAYGFGSNHFSGGSYGIGAGYDLALGHSGVIVGAEINGDLSSIDECVSDATSRVCVKARRDLSALVRLGKHVGGALAYIKAGYANARFASTATISGPPQSFSSAHNNTGARVGAGVEYPVRRRAYVKAEYQYSNYEAHLSRHQILGGIGLRF